MKIIYDLLRVGDIAMNTYNYSAPSAEYDTFEVDKFLINSISLNKTGAAIWYPPHSTFVSTLFSIYAKYPRLIEVEIDISNMSSYLQNELINYSENYKIKSYFESFYEDGLLTGKELKHIKIVHLYEQVHLRQRKMRLSKDNSILDNIEDFNDEEANTIIGDLKRQIGVQ